LFGALKASNWPLVFVLPPNFFSEPSSHLMLCFRASRFGQSTWSDCFLW